MVFDSGCYRKPESACSNAQAVSEAVSALSGRVVDMQVIVCGDRTSEKEKQKGKMLWLNYLWKH